MGGANGNPSSFFSVLHCFLQPGLCGGFFPWLPATEMRPIPKKCAPRGDHEQQRLMALLFRAAVSIEINAVPPFAGC